MKWLKKISRRWATRRLLARAARTPWHGDLLRCQERLAQCAPHPNYAAAYRHEEFLYWARVPGWIEALKPARGARVLDVGAAYGTLSLFMRVRYGCEVSCMDFLDIFFSPQLRDEFGIQHRVSNVELDPLPFEGPFDLILLTEVLEHFNFNPVPTLRKLRSALAPGGRVFLTTPDAAEWGRVTAYYPDFAAIPQPAPGLPVIDDHVWQYDRAELEQVVREAGFRILNLAYAPGTLGRHFNLELEGA
jgi:SAM-dependent methyltransferase